MEMKCGNSFWNGYEDEDDDDDQNNGVMTTAFLNTNYKIIRNARGRASQHIKKYIFLVKININYNNNL